MPTEKINALKSLVNWFDSISFQKKTYALIILFLFLLFTQYKVYDTRVFNINCDNIIRNDSLVRYYTNKLENCNSENKKDYRNIIRVLQNGLEVQKETELEAKRLKLETEKLKQSLSKRK